MSIRRFEGRNVEEALDTAAEQLGVERYKLGYHVVVEKRGFLGGTKRVVIEAWEDDNIGNRIDGPPASPSRLEQGPSRGRTGSRSGGGRERRDRGAERGGGRGRGERGGGRRGERGEQRGRRAEHPREARPEEKREDLEIPYVVEPAPPVAENEPEASRRLREWFARLFELSGLALEARVEQNEERFTVRLYGEDVGKLLSRHGELLDSIQIIANKTMVVRNTGLTVELDAGEFREKRTDDLGKQARRVADQVRLDAKERALPAMSPVERRIVHLALRDDADVETYSRGDGFYKRVVVTPRRTPPESGAAES